MIRSETRVKQKILPSSRLYFFSDIITEAEVFS